MQRGARLHQRRIMRVRTLSSVLERRGLTTSHVPADRAADLLEVELGSAVVSYRVGHVKFYRRGELRGWGNDTHYDPVAATTASSLAASGGCGDGGEVELAVSAMARRTPADHLATPGAGVPFTDTWGQQHLRDTHKTELGLDEHEQPSRLEQTRQVAHHIGVARHLHQHALDVDQVWCQLQAKLPTHRTSRRPMGGEASRLESVLRTHGSELRSRWIILHHLPTVWKSALPCGSLVPSNWSQAMSMPTTSEYGWRRASEMAHEPVPVPTSRTLERRPDTWIWSRCWCTSWSCRGFRSDIWILCSAS